VNPDPVVFLALVAAIGLWFLVRHPKMTSWIEAGLTRVFVRKRKTARDIMHTNTFPKR
jgi:hypothetical protein